MDDNNRHHILRSDMSGTSLGTENSCFRRVFFEITEKTFRLLNLKKSDFSFKFEFLKFTMKRIFFLLLTVDVILLM